MKIIIDVEKEKKEKKKMKTANKVLAIIGLFLFAFIVAMIVIFCKYGATPDTLIMYVLGAGSVEAIVLATIKVSKVFNGYNADKHNEVIEDERGDI